MDALCTHGRPNSSKKLRRSPATPERHGDEQEIKQRVYRVMSGESQNCLGQYTDGLVIDDRPRINHQPHVNSQQSWVDVTDIQAVKRAHRTCKQEAGIAGPGPRLGVSPRSIDGQLPLIKHRHSTARPDDAYTPDAGCRYADNVVQQKTNQLDDPQAVNMQSLDAAVESAPLRSAHGDNGDTLVTPDSSKRVKDNNNSIWPAHIHPDSSDEVATSHDCLEAVSAEWPEFMATVQYPSSHEEARLKTIDDIDENCDPATEFDNHVDQPPQDTLHWGVSIDDHNAMVTKSSDLAKWPFPHQGMDKALASIYDQVKLAGLPNYNGAKIRLDSMLNIDQWERARTSHHDDDMVIAGIKYGYPIQYAGPPMYNNVQPDNHPTATRYQGHVNRYIQEEIALGAMMGPSQQPPLTPWCVVSPFMTRDKSEPGEKRVIVDLSYPNGGIDKYIHQRTYNGEHVTHQLPTIQTAIKTLNHIGTEEAYLAVVDLKRAYRHFPVCPADWSLLVMCNEGQYVVDRALPFGARMGSLVMQRVAEFIVRALQARGVTAHMYLDDVLVITKGKDKATRDYYTTLNFIKDLGLALAESKLQPPARQVKWLGIVFNMEQIEISIPADKLSSISQCLAHASRQHSLSIKRMQRVVGVVNHLAKAGAPARLFIGRILAALRSATDDNIRPRLYV